MNGLAETRTEKLAHNPEMRAKILAMQNIILSTPGHMENDCFPLKHTFADGIYIREIFLPKNYVTVTKIHKFAHPYFILSGDVSVMTEEGPVRIKAPFHGITKAGTKRVLFTHEDSVWVTVHQNIDNITDIEELEKILIIPEGGMV